MCQADLVEAGALMAIRGLMLKVEVAGAVFSGGGGGGGYSGR